LVEAIRSGIFLKHSYLKQDEKVNSACLYVP
jgi:hypothetical protein